MKQYLFFSIIFLFFNTSVMGQAKIDTITLNEFGYEYKIIVTLPTDFDAQKDYPTLYYLDAEFIGNLIRGSVNVLKTADYINDVALVGITVAGDKKEINKQRAKYFTPSKFKTLSLKQQNTKYKINYSVGIAPYSIPLNAETTGQASKFLEFISKKVIPKIEEKYPNLNQSKAFLGHSFGGLFGAFTLIKKPDLFNDYILISGSLSWNEGELLNTNLEKLKHSTIAHKIYLTYGGEEPGITQKSNYRLGKIIQYLDSDEKLDLHFHNYPKVFEIKK